MRLWYQTIIGDGPQQDPTDITAIGASIVTSISPVASNPATNNQITITKHTFTIPHTALSAANINAIWFRIERVDSASGGGVNSTFNINNLENFYVMDNIRMQSYYNPCNLTAPLPEAIYEQSILASSFIDPVTNAFLPLAVDDVAGALITQTSGATPALKFTAALDDRYDDTCGLILDVFLSLDNASVITGDVIYSLKTGYQNAEALSDKTDNDIYDTEQAAGLSFNILPPIAGRRTFCKVQFLIDPSSLWGTSPDSYFPNQYNDANINMSNDKGIIKFLLSRTDDIYGDHIVLCASLRSLRANKTKLSTVTPKPIDSLVTKIPTYPHTDQFNSLNLSIQRQTFKFCFPDYYVNGGNTLADGAEVNLMPPSIALSCRSNPYPGYIDDVSWWGHQITHSLAVTRVSGWIGTDNTLGGIVPLNYGLNAIAPYDPDAIEVYLMVTETPFRSADPSPGPSGVANQQNRIWPKRPALATDILAYGGIQALPMYFSFYNGYLMWRPGEEFGLTSRHASSPPHQLGSQLMPKILLPAPNHSITNTTWQLVMMMKNATGGSIIPFGEVEVEVAILPNPSRHAGGNPHSPIMGGAPSGGVGWK